MFLTSVISIVYSESAAAQEAVNYYGMAHTVKESIIEQPSLLIGGKLKEYQVKI